MKDELKKLGLRIRPRTTDSERSDTPRGNAKFEWTRRHSNADSDTGERASDASLFHPDLSVIEDQPAPNAPIRSNPKGLRQGYNPYESGLLAKQEWKSKRNLRELSDWIEAQRKRNSRPPEED